MGGAESKGNDTVWGCCETRSSKGVPRTENISSRLCGVGMGLDSQLLAANRVIMDTPEKFSIWLFEEWGISFGYEHGLIRILTRQGAVVTCLAKGGPADQAGSVQIGDTLVFVDDLDVRELMNNVRSRSCSFHF